MKPKRELRRVRVYVTTTGNVPPVPDCPFTDIANVTAEQHDAMCQLWGLGVVEGIERDVFYSPDISFGAFANIYLEILAAVVKSSP